MTIRRVQLYGTAKTRSWPFFTYPAEATLQRSKCARTSALLCWITVSLVMTRMGGYMCRAREYANIAFV